MPKYDNAPDIQVMSMSEFMDRQGIPEKKKYTEEEISLMKDSFKKVGYTDEEAIFLLENINDNAKDLILKNMKK